ncbi:DNA polymerase III beta subunit, central domain-containing protein [Ditylenchus destructor]|uniref:DNA polymerase III beta subunit, central domain-containing protein n=1 Tax=Ditylenchus destructor TaxID=166010 RepID=A0AAD4MF29_9BILA|nr:DNA polymerase III beta subunit, central domain-containing protein [Ditylenchus destructor]
MKATIERATLLRGLSHVQSVVERRNTIPILSNVLIEASAEGSLRLMATDLDLQIDETVRRRSIRPARSPYRRTRCSTSRASFPRVAGRIDRGRGQDQDQRRPRQVRAGHAAAARRFPADHRQDRFAISTEETRYYLNGIFLHVADDTLKAAATDGHRLARVTVARPDGAESMPDVIVPRKCVAELRKLLDEVDGSVGVSLSGSKIRFDLGAAILTSKLIDGTFPDYSRVIPTGNDKILKIDPKSFMEGVDRVSTIATEKTRAVKMALDRDRITLSVTSPDNGTAAEDVPGEYAAQPFEIGFNSRYLMDILGQVEGDSGRSASGRRRRADADPRERQVARALRADADAGLTRPLYARR